MGFGHPTDVGDSTMATFHVENIKLVTYHIPRRDSDLSHSLGLNIIRHVIYLHCPLGEINTHTEGYLAAPTYLHRRCWKHRFVNSCRLWTYLRPL